MSSIIHSLYGQIFRLWRKRRFDWFINKIAPAKGDLLLDVGGYPGFWTRSPQLVARIDSLNVHPVDWDPASHPNYNIHPLVGDGCNLSAGDGSYDIGFSNSVIEHVGDWENQKQFASEIRRVSRKLWVQTPAYECPFEPHYLTPCIHYLPKETQKKIVRNFTVWGWLERPDKARVESTVSTTRLLKKSEMQELFPDCQIIVEPLIFGLPKSYVAVR